MAGGDKFRKLTRSDKPSITVWNELLMMLQWWKNWRNRPSTDNRGRGQLGQGQVMVRNDSEQNVSQFQVLGLDGPVFTPDDSERAFVQDLVFKGVLPRTSPSTANALGHSGKFAIMIEPVRAGGIGVGQIAGCSAVKVQVDDAAKDYQFAEIIDGERATLRAQCSGSCSITWKEPGKTGSVWATVRLDGREQHATRWAQFTGSGTWTKGTSLALQLLDDGLHAIAGQTVTASNDFLDVEYDPSKFALLIGRGRSMVLLAVDPCAPGT